VKLVLVSKTPWNNVISAVVKIQDADHVIRTGERHNGPIIPTMPCVS